MLDNQRADLEQYRNTKQRFFHMIRNRHLYSSSHRDKIWKEYVSIDLKDKEWLEREYFLSRSL